MYSSAYVNSFIKTCAARGIDPEQLLKMAATMPGTLQQPVGTPAPTVPSPTIPAPTPTPPAGPPTPPGRPQPMSWLQNMGAKQPGPNMYAGLKGMTNMGANTLSAGGIPQAKNLSSS